MQCDYKCNIFVLQSLRLVGDQVRVYPAFRPVTAGTGSGTPTTLVKISGRMDGGITIIHARKQTTNIQIQDIAHVSLAYVHVCEIIQWNQMSTDIDHILSSLYNFLMLAV